MRVELKLHTHTVKEGNAGNHAEVLLPGEACAMCRKRRAEALKSISALLGQIQAFYSNNEGPTNGISCVLYLSPT